jgi:hypothetical protein
MTTDNLPKPQREARGLSAAGNSGNPGGRPAKVEKIESLAQAHNRKRSRKSWNCSIAKMRVIALAPANSILDKAFAKPAQSMAAKVETLAVGRLWLEVVARSHEAQ